MKLRIHQNDVPEDLRQFFKPARRRCGVCYVCHIVEVFREVKRVLHPSGTLWLNLGDCYATAPNGRSAKATKAAGDDRTFRDKPFGTAGMLKAKNLCLIPARVARQVLAPTHH